MRAASVVTLVKHSSRSYWGHYERGADRSPSASKVAAFGQRNSASEGSSWDASRASHSRCTGTFLSYPTPGDLGWPDVNCGESSQGRGTLAA